MRNVNIVESPWGDVGAGAGSLLGTLLRNALQGNKKEKEAIYTGLDVARTTAETTRDTTEYSKLASLLPPNMRGEYETSRGITLPEAAPLPAPTTLGGAAVNMPQSSITANAPMPWPTNPSQTPLAAGFGRMRGREQGLPTGVGLTTPEVQKAEADKATAVLMDKLNTVGRLEPNQQGAAGRMLGLGGRLPAAVPKTTKPVALPLSTIMENFNVTPQQAAALWSAQERGQDIGPMLAQLTKKAEKPSGKQFTPPSINEIRTFAEMYNPTEEESRLYKTTGATPSRAPSLQKTLQLDEGVITLAAKLAGYAKSPDLLAYTRVLQNPEAPASTSLLQAAAGGMLEDQALKAARAALTDKEDGIRIAKVAGNKGAVKELERQYQLEVQEFLQRFFGAVPVVARPGFFKRLALFGQKFVDTVTHLSAPKKEQTGTFNPLK